MRGFAPKDSSRVPRNLAPRQQSSRWLGSHETVGIATNSCSARSISCLARKVVHDQGLYPAGRSGCSVSE